MFIPSIPIRLLKRMILTPSTLSSPSFTHPALSFLFLLTTGVHPSSSSLTYHMSTFPFLSLPFPSSLQLPQAHMLSVTASLPPPDACARTIGKKPGHDELQLGLQCGSPKTKVEADTTGRISSLAPSLPSSSSFFFLLSLPLESCMHSKKKLHSQTKTSYATDEARLPGNIRSYGSGYLSFLMAGLNQ